MMALRRKSLGVNTAATPRRRKSSASSGGMMPPTTTGTSSRPLSAHALHHLRHQRGVAAGEDGEADEMHGLVAGGAHDLRGGEADALVDHLHAAVAGAHGDLLGPVGVAVEAGLADQELDAAAEALRHALHLGPHVAQALLAAQRRQRVPTPVGARYSPNTARSAAPHSPVVTPALAQAMDGSMTLRPSLAAASSSGQRPLHGRARRGRRARRRGARSAPSPPPGRPPRWRRRPPPAATARSRPSG